MLAELMLGAYCPSWLATLDEIEEILRERMERARNQYDTDRNNPAHARHYVETLRQFADLTVNGRIPEDFR
jgi:hypothetical protein